MSIIIRACVASLLLASSVMGPAKAIVHFDAARVKTLTHSVIHVMCPDKSRSGTGFIYRRSDWVITALHVVAGCKSIEAKSDVFMREEPATLQRVSKTNDLALLRLERPDSRTPPLALAIVNADFPSSELVLIGYDRDLSRAGEQFLVSKCCRNTLGQILTIAEGNALTSPTPSTPIIELDGALVKGHSGAPIFDQQGRVVAVGDGGLSAAGNIQTSWAIPARLFRALESSREDKNDPRLEQSSELLFASEMQSGFDTPFSSLGGTVITVGSTEVTLPAVFQNHTLFVAIAENDKIIDDAKTLMAALGASITYDPDFHMVEFTKPGASERQQVGTHMVDINGEHRPLNSAPFTYKNYVMVNLHVVSEALGAEGPYADTGAQPAVWRIQYTPPTPSPRIFPSLPAKHRTTSAMYPSR